MSDGETLLTREMRDAAKAAREFILAEMHFSASVKAGIDMDAAWATYNAARVAVTPAVFKLLGVMANGGKP